MNFHTEQRGWASVCLEIYSYPCTRNDNTSLLTCFTPNRLINSQPRERNESRTGAWTHHARPPSTGLVTSFTRLQHDSLIYITRYFLSLSPHEGLSFFFSLIGVENELQIDVTARLDAKYFRKRPPPPKKF